MSDNHGFLKALNRVAKTHPGVIGRVFLEWNGKGSYTVVLYEGMVKKSSKSVLQWHPFDQAIIEVYEQWRHDDT